MRIRPETCLLLIGAAMSLGGCAQSCFKSSETVLSQVSVGDAAAPDVVIPQFPVMPVREASGCVMANPVRLELYIDPSGYARGVTFLDPWPNVCANEYVRKIESAQLVQAPLAQPLEHFRVDLRYSQVSHQQCIKMNP